MISSNFFFFLFNLLNFLSLKMNKSPKKGREKSKTRLWEKERRNRLNEYFNKLWEVLPIYDASKTLSKAEILINAASTIKELDKKLKDLLTNSGEEKSSVEKHEVSVELIKKLQDRVKKLLLRNEQLFQLLKSSGLKIPTECGSTTKKLFKKPLKYSNIITKKQQSSLLEKGLEKENNVERAPLIKANKVVKKLRNNNKKTTFNKNKQKFLKKQMLTSSSNCVLLLSNGNIQNNQCFVLPNKTAQNPKIGSSTIVFTDPTALLPIPRPIFPTILTNPIPTIVIVSSNNDTIINNNNNKPLIKENLGVINNSGVNSLPILRPRTNITKTTQVNKVPIPALTTTKSKYNAKDFNNLNNNNKKINPSDNFIKENNKKLDKKVKENKREKNLVEITKPEEKGVEKLNSVEPAKVPSEEINLNDHRKINIINQKSFNFPTPSEDPKKTDLLHQSVNELKTLDLNFGPTELETNDIFATFSQHQNHESSASASPTAAFLLAFPVVSSGVKVPEVIGGDENSCSQPNLMQIGTLDTTKPTQTYGDSLLTPNLLNFDNNFSFFSNNTTENKNIMQKVPPPPPPPPPTTTTTLNSHQYYYNNKSAVEKVTIMNNSSLDIGDLFSASYKTPSSSSSATASILPSLNDATNQLLNNYKNTSDLHTCTSFCTTFGTCDNFSSFQYNSKNSQNFVKDTKKLENNKLINWMTTPTASSTTNSASYKAPDYFLPPFSKDSYNTTSYFNTSDPLLTIANGAEFINKKNTEIPALMSFQNNFVSAEAENQFSCWSSPTKMMPHQQILDTVPSSSFLPSSTLPTLIGDLALNNNNINNNPIIEQNNKKMSSRRKSGNLESSGGSSFFSVSQLVEETHPQPGKVISKRMSNGNRGKIISNGKNRIPHQQHHQEIILKSKNITKSSYSAEALIGSASGPDKINYNNNCQKSQIPTFLNDSSFYPSSSASVIAESSTVVQENVFMQNFQPHQQSFNNNFMMAPSSSSSSSSIQEILPDFNSSTRMQNSKNCSNNKRVKKSMKCAAETSTVLPSFDIHFLSTPGVVNSSILAEDFHQHGHFLPTSTKNPSNILYNNKTGNNNFIPTLSAPNHRNLLQHQPLPQLSPIVPNNSANNNNNNTLTNFNLSAIFPEINHKGIVQDQNFQENNKSKIFNNNNSHHGRSFSNEPLFH